MPRVRMLASMTLGLLLLQPALRVTAGTIDFSGYVVASGPSGPILIPGYPQRAFVDLCCGMLQATAISGVPALAGVPASSVTFSFGDVELVAYSLGAISTLYYLDADGSPGYLNVFVSGAPFAAGSGVYTEVLMDTDPLSTTVGYAAARGSAQLAGGMRGLIEFTVNPFNGLATGASTYFYVNGRFTIPELAPPAATSLALLALALIRCGAGIGMGHGPGKMHGGAAPQESDK